MSEQQKPRKQEEPKTVFDHGAALNAEAVKACAAPVKREHDPIRDQFAAAAMASLCQEIGKWGTSAIEPKLCEMVAINAYRIADAMLRVR
jgi:endonuclease YncB( thermonuclease family)